MRSLVLFLLPCLVAVLVRVWWIRSGTDSVWEPPSAGSGAAAGVLVGVLSARQHRELRQAIRDTWLNYITQHPHLHKRMSVKFIVGERSCDIPEEDREDPYSCTLLNITMPVVDGDVSVLTLPDFSALVESDVSVVSLDFKVLHPVVISQLGVFPSGPRAHLRANVTVTLFQVDQQDAVVSAHFSAQSPGDYMDGMWYKRVEQFILPQGFEGTLQWESMDAAGLMTINVSGLQLNSGGGALRFGPIEEGTLPHRSATGFPGLAGGFTFSLYGLESLAERLQARPSRMQLHAARLAQEERELRDERRHYGDLVFVDVLDTYRTVPSKLLHFYKWAVKNSDFNLLLKTDDDCYVDVDTVLKKIEHKNLSRSNLWWGNFRQNWAVDRVGKWQELDYSSPVYPAFACGSGYVVSRDLVEWLSSNAHKLKPYQGEDVSMGIWMSAVGPHKYQDAGWLCERGCYVDMLSSPQHTVEDLRSFWRRRSLCGDPCSC